MVARSLFIDSEVAEAKDVSIITFTVVKNLSILNLLPWSRNLFLKAHWIFITRLLKGCCQKERLLHSTVNSILTEIEGYINYQHLKATKANEVNAFQIDKMTQPLACESDLALVMWGPAAYDLMC